MTQTSITASGKTGSVCQVSGPYASERNKTYTLFIAKGDKFPVDPRDRQPTTWVMIKG